jgi:hypothetical protein
MCWSRQVSLATGWSASILSFLLLVRGRGNDIPVALVSLTIAAMQFAEAYMWESIEIPMEQVEDRVRKVETATRGARAGMTSLFVQPLVLGLVSLVWGRAKATPLRILGFVSAWACLALPTFFEVWERKWVAPALPGSRGHLEWAFLPPIRNGLFPWLYWPVMLFAWLLLVPLWEGAFYSFMSVLTLILTVFFYPGEWGSLWCFLANALPLARCVIG